MKMPSVLCKCMGLTCTNQHFEDFPPLPCANTACFSNHLWEDGAGEAFACSGQEQDGLYPVASGQPIPTGHSREMTRVKATGEYRRPKAGDWYLSGALKEGHYAKNDHAKNDLLAGEEYQIAKLVYGRVVFDE